jgi:hypothetical protein
MAELERISNHFGRCHIRDASWFQWPLLEAAIENNIVADFPLCNKVVQLLLFGTRSLTMRTLLLKSSLAKPATIKGPAADSDAIEEVGRALEARTRRIFGRSITIREVDAGSCNGCELLIHAHNSAIYDVERFGLRLPRRRAMPTCCSSPAP